MKTELITGDLIVSNGFIEHDEIALKISRLNISLGLKTILGGAWTYEKLAKNASIKLCVPYSEAYRMGIDKLIELV